MEEFITDEESKVKTIEVESVENVKYLNDDKTLIVADVKFSDFKDVLPYSYELDNLDERANIVNDYLVLHSINIQSFKVNLDELKKSKHEQLKLEMISEKNNALVEYDNDKFNANNSAQDNMNALLNYATIGKNTFEIRSVNEVTHIFNSDQLRELAVAMFTAIDNIYCRYWLLKDELKAAETEDEVLKISW